MAEGVVLVTELESRYNLPGGFLDEECTDDHTRRIALLLESWELLASHLGLSTAQIDAIKEDNRSQEVKRMNALTKWKETFAFKATYRKLLEALLNINQANLACKVCELLVTPNFEQAKLKQNCKQLEPAPLIPIVPHPISSGTSEVIARIEGLFLDLVVSVEEYFEEYVPLIKLQRYSCHLPVNLMAPFGQLFESKESQIWRTHTVRELFRILKYFWDYLQPDLLCYLVSRFAPQDSEIVDQMSRYVTELSTFRKKIKIPDYIGERSINLVDEDYSPIVATLGDEWYEKTLADLEEVRSRFSKKFCFLRLLPKMNGLKFNSIALVFSVPKSVQFNRDELCEFFRSYNVLKLMVGEEWICNDQLQDVFSANDSYQEPSKSGGFTCEFVEKPPKGVQCECPVCLQILREPHQVTCCGYSFCKVCIERLKDKNKHCPTCNRESITIFPDQRLQRSLYDNEVYCTHRAKGCTWRGELRQLENHLNEEPQVDRELEGCLFARVDCKFKSVGCEERVTRGEVPAHLKNHSEIHLSLLQSSKSSLDKAFLEGQELIAILGKKILDIICTQNLMNQQHKQQIEELERLKEQQIEELERLKEQQIEELERLKEQQIASVSVALKQITKEYEILKEHVFAVPVPLSSSRASVERLLPTPFTGTPTSPVYFTLTNFDALKRADLHWQSPPFYTHHHGYKMNLYVHPNGPLSTQFYGKSVSAQIGLKRGEFDKHLKWPFRGDITITLLDQEDHNRYHSRTICFNEATPNDTAGRVRDGNTAKRIQGKEEYISHNDLGPYLKNDCLMFKITVSDIHH